MKVRAIPIAISEVLFISWITWCSHKTKWTMLSDGAEPHSVETLDWFYAVRPKRYMTTYSWPISTFIHSSTPTFRPHVFDIEYNIPTATMSDNIVMHSNMLTAVTSLSIKYTYYSLFAYRKGHTWVCNIKNIHTPHSGHRATQSDGCRNTRQPIRIYMHLCVSLFHIRYLTDIAGRKIFISIIYDTNWCSDACSYGRAYVTMNIIEFVFLWRQLSTKLGDKSDLHKQGH